MLGDVQLGAVLRALREGRELTLAAVARRAGCVESTLSYVECGHRRLLPWLAQELDRIYATGGMIAALASGVSRKPPEDPTSGVSSSDVFVVLLPQGGVTMPLFRREVMTALGLGIVTGGLQGQFERALEVSISMVISCTLFRPRSMVLKRLPGYFRRPSSLMR